jgi:hypothetical protein
MGPCGWRAGEQLRQQRRHDHIRATQRRKTTYYLLTEATQMADKQALQAAGVPAQHVDAAAALGLTPQHVQQAAAAGFGPSQWAALMAALPQLVNLGMQAWAVIGPIFGGGRPQAAPQPPAQPPPAQPRP